MAAYLASGVALSPIIGRGRQNCGGVAKKRGKIGRKRETKMAQALANAANRGRRRRRIENRYHQRAAWLGGGPRGHAAGGVAYRGALA